MNKKTSYASAVNDQLTPQTKPLRGSNQVANSAGGFSFAVTPWALFDRFLILGAEGGTYYASQNKLVVKNTDNFDLLLKTDAIKMIDRIVEVSDKGLAAKNAAAIYALAYVAAKGDTVAKKHAMQNLSKVCRTSTDLFSFVSQYKNDLGGGFGSVMTKGLSAWYTGKDDDSLAFQLVKYRQRDGWTHHDLMHLAHPKAASESQNAVFRYAKVLDGRAKVVDTDISKLPQIVKAYEQAKVAKNVKEVLTVIRDNPRFPREAVPTEFLNSPDVWDAMLADMPAHALVRNLGKISSLGLLKPLSQAQKSVVAKLSDSAWLKKSRMHPIQLLMAHIVYSRGRGIKGDLSWDVNRDVQNALDGAFYKAFDNVTPTGKNFFLGVDVSGSMFGSPVMGAEFMTAAHVAFAMSLVIKNVEPNCHVMGFSHKFVDLKVQSGEKLDVLMRRINGIPFGRTDCSLPMEYAIENKLDVDAFVVITDNETYAGRRHPSEALKAYRQQSGRGAKLAVFGTSLNNFTIADPRDSGMLDIVGFSTDTPTVLNSFVGAK